MFGPLDWLFTSRRENDFSFIRYYVLIHLYCIHTFPSKKERFRVSLTTVVRFLRHASSGIRGLISAKMEAQEDGALPLVSLVISSIAPTRHCLTGHATPQLIRNDLRTDVLISHRRVDFRRYIGKFVRRKR